MKTVLITGASSGLGFETARSLAASEDWHVVLACRDRERALAAAREMMPSRTTCVSLDLTSLQSVRELARTLPDSPLHAIVCNAAVQHVQPHSTADGFEATFGVNHLGHFLLVQLLLPRLARPGRIVFVASGTHDGERFSGGMPGPRYTSARSLAHALPDEGESAGHFGRRAYATSKLCNVLCAYQLARLTPDVTCNAFDPGLMPGSGLARDYGALARFAWNAILPALRPFSKQVNGTRTSARALARLVTDPSLAEVTGAYFEGMRRVNSSKLSYDETLARDLWNTSLELTGRPAAGVLGDGTGLQPGVGSH